MPNEPLIEWAFKAQLGTKVWEWDGSEIRSFYVTRIYDSFSVDCTGPTPYPGLGMFADLYNKEPHRFESGYRIELFRLLIPRFGIQMIASHPSDLMVAFASLRRKGFVQAPSRQV